MQKYKRVVATVGKYKDNEGNEKKRYVNVGTLFKAEDGSLSLKLDSVPIGPDWSGWLSFYDLDKKEPMPHDKAKADAYQPAPAALDDEIPF